MVGSIVWISVPSFKIKVTLRLWSCTTISTCPEWIISTAVFQPTWPGNGLGVGVGEAMAWGLQEVIAKVNIINTDTVRCLFITKLLRYISI
jgi:hypothetical protein